MFYLQNSILLFFFFASRMQLSWCPLFLHQPYPDVEKPSFVKNTTCCTDAEEKGNYLIFDISGNGFRRYMVRMIVGTLIEVGLGNIDSSFVKEALDGGKYNRVRYKAPSEGLYLSNVEYGGELLDAQD